MEHHHADLGDVRLHYVEAGSGPLACPLTMGDFETGFMSAAKLLLSPSSSVQAAFLSAG